MALDYFQIFNDDITLGDEGAELPADTVLHGH